MLLYFDCSLGCANHAFGLVTEAFLFVVETHFGRLQ